MTSLLRYLAFSGCMSLAFYTGRLSVEWQATGRLPGLAPHPAPVLAEHEACTDACEQAVIVGKGSDLQLRACRARCDADHPLPEPVREVPTKITVAPADHHR